MVKGHCWGRQPYCIIQLTLDRSIVPQDDWEDLLVLWEGLGEFVAVYNNMFRENNVRLQKQEL